MASASPNEKPVGDSEKEPSPIRRVAFHPGRSNIILGEDLAWLLSGPTFGASSDRPSTLELTKDGRVEIGRYDGKRFLPWGGAAYPLTGAYFERACQLVEAYGRTRRLPLDPRI